METLTYWARWYRVNRDRLLKKQRARREADREAINAGLRQWRRNNPERFKREPSRNSLYRKLRRCGVDRVTAMKQADVTLCW